MSKKRGTGINVGSISILVIFVLLCLTTFATLSLVSANADKKLTDTAAKSLLNFYSADSKAEEILANIDGGLKKADIGTSKQDYFNNCINSLSNFDAISTTLVEEKLTLSYIASIDDKKQLQVSLDILYPTKNSKERYKIVKWQTVNIAQAEDEVDATLNLWNGNDNLNISK